MKEREHSHSEIEKANCAEQLGHAEKWLDIKVLIYKQMHTQTDTKTHKEKLFKM